MPSVSAQIVHKVHKVHKLLRLEESALKLQEQIDAVQQTTEICEGWTEFGESCERFALAPKNLYSMQHVASLPRSRKLASAS